MKYLILILCLLISSICFNCIQYPNHIVSGGIPGIAIIINSFTNINPSTIISIISILLFIISFIFLGKIKTISSLVSTLIYPLFIKLTSNLFTITINPILASIIIGTITGISVGLIYKIGFNNGGISIVIEIISKYTKLSIPIISFIINIFIILIGSINNINMLVYSSIIIFINSIVIRIILKKTSTIKNSTYDK